MDLKEKALDLSKILHQLITALQVFDENEKQAEYTKKMAAALTPYVTKYDNAVFIKGSINEASGILIEMQSLISNLCGAATKGDIYFDRDNILNRYLQLEKILRNSESQENT